MKYIRKNPEVFEILKVDFDNFEKIITFGSIKTLGIVFHKDDTNVEIIGRDFNTECALGDYIIYNYNKSTFEILTKEELDEVIDMFEEYKD